MMKKRSKKQYRSIAGQRWYEKVIDRIALEETFQLFLKYHFFMIAYLFLWSIAAITIWNGETHSLRFLLPFLKIYPLFALLLVMNCVCRLWSFRAEKKLQQPILQYVRTQGHCTYDELVVRCMPLKIHLGIDSAIETMLLERRLVLDADDCYRLPTDEDRKKWRQEWLDSCVKIPFEDLKRLFSLHIKDLEEEITIEFSLGEHDGCWMGKREADGAQTEAFWLCTDTGKHREFATFQSMVTAKLFDGRSLEELWNHAVITFLNDYGDMDLWLEAHLPPQ